MNPFLDELSGMIGFEDCESLVSSPTKRATFAEKNSARHSLKIWQLLGTADLDNANWPPGRDNPADGSTRTRGDMVPLLRLFGIWRF